MRRLAVLLLAVLLVAACTEAPKTLTEVVAAVKSQPEWLADAATCPADATDRAEVESLPEAQYCDANNGACLARCVDGSGAACYWLAYRLETGKLDAASVDALYMRACRLGVASGCTNRAVRGATDGSGTVDAQCELTSFERACELDDPWGCTMFAFRLSSSSGSEADRTRALAALDKSCADGADDPACIAGRDLAEKLQP